MSEKKRRQKKALEDLSKSLSYLNEKTRKMDTMFDMVSDILESIPDPTGDDICDDTDTNARCNDDGYQTFASSVPYLFKAKLSSHAFEGRWVIGDLMHNRNKTISIIRDGQRYAVIHNTLCIFSGLYDNTPYDSLDEKQKNICKAFYGDDFNQKIYKGIPVFEGDILYYTDSDADETDDDALNYGYITIFNGHVFLTNRNDVTMSDLIYDETINASFQGNIFNPDDIKACEEKFNTEWSF